jgi:hypothetical protein
MAAGSIVQGIGGYKAGKFNRKVANRNARMAEQEGVANAERIRNLGRIAMGRQIGAQAESGFEVGTGSAIDSLIESATNIELDAMDARREASSRAYAYRTQGHLAYMEGRNKLIGGFFGAASTVAGGMADYAAAKGG